MATPDASHPASEAPSPRGRRALRRILRALAGALIVVVGLVLIVLLLLQTNWGAETAARLIARQVNPFTNAAIRIGSVEGNWLRTLELRDVALVPTDRAAATTRFAHIDTLRVEYRLPSLLGGTFHVRSVALAGPSASIRQRTDSTWLLPERAPTPAEPDTTPPSFTVRIDRARLTRGRMTAQFYTPRGDSTLRVQNVHLGAHDLTLGPSITGRLDTLGVDAVLPGLDTPLQLQAAAALTPDRFTLGGLHVTSPHTRVHGEGTLRRPTAPEDSLDDVHFTLTAAPLSFRDVAPFVPGATLDPNEALHLDLQARGTGRLIALRADARLSTGGTLAVDAAVTPRLPAENEAVAPGPLRYQVGAQVRALGTDLLATAEPTAPTRVNADLQLDVEGPALNQLSGTAAVHLFDTQLSGYALHSTQLAFRFSNGRALVDGNGQFAEAAFAVNGTLKPFAEPLTYDLRAKLSDLNVGTFMEAAGQESALNARLHVDGRGISPASARVTAQLDVLPSTLNRQRIESGHLTVRYARDTVRYDSRFAFPEGRFAMAGRALLTEPLRYTVERGRFASVHVAALMGDTTRSALNGTFRLHGRDLTPAAMQLETSVELQDSYYGGYVLNEATTHAVLRAGRLDLDLDANLQGGRLALAATARPFAEPLVLRTARGRFRAVDLGALLQDTTRSSDLNGTFRLSGRGPVTDPGGTWEAHLALDRSRLNQQPIEAARVDAVLQAARLDAALQLDTPAGRTRLAGHARPFDALPTYALTEGTLRDLDLGALAGVPSARTALNGSVALEGRGFDLTTMSLDAELDLAASTVNRARLEHGTLQANVENGEGSVGGRFDLAQGRMTLEAALRTERDRPAYRFRGRLTDVNAAALAGVDSLEARVSLGLQVEGEGFDPATLRLRGRLTGGSSRYASVRLDTLDARVQMTDGLLRVDTLLARSNVATARGGGQIALYDSTDQYASDFLIEAYTTNISPLRPLLGARQLSLDEGRIEGRVYGNPGAVRFDASATLTDLLYDEMQVADLEAQIAGARGDTTAFSALEARGEVGLFSYGDFSIVGTQFSARYGGHRIDFSTSLTVDQDRNARIAGLVDLRPGREQLVLQRFDMKLGPNQWTLLQEASIAYGDAYRISNLLLYSDRQQIAADGVIDFDGRQSLIVTLENVETASITDLLGFQGLGGRLSGTLAMSGPAERPQITSTLNLGVRSFDRRVGRLALRANYDSLRAEIHAVLTHEDGSRLSVEGRVPVDLRLTTPADTVNVMDDPIHLTLSAETFSIGWIDPFLDPETAQDVTGQLDAAVTLAGTLDTPALSGSSALRNGHMELPALGTTYDRIGADLDFTGEQVQVHQLSVRSPGGGRLRAEGTINLTDLTLGAYDLDVDTQDFLAIDTREYRARVDSDLMVSGTTRRPVVEGTAQVESADIYFLAGSQAETNLTTVQLSREDRQTIERRFGIRLTPADTTTFDTYQAMAMDLSVQFERDTWLRSRSNPTMDIQFTGDLDVQKPHFEDAQVFGSIEVIPERSRVVQFGKEFQIQEGTLTFNGPPGEPVMDIRAVYQVRAHASRENEVEIVLSITGPPDDLNLSLSSNPPMDTNNILSYLAVGRPADQLLGGGPNGNGAGQQSLGERLVIGQAAGYIENLAASQLGLDVVRIEPTPNGTIFLTAGQYFSPRFYAAVQQSITDEPGAQVTSNVPDITLEYQLTPWLLLRSIYRNPDLRLNFFWEYAY